MVATILKQKATSSLSPLPGGSSEDGNAINNDPAYDKSNTTIADGISKYNNSVVQPTVPIISGCGAEERHTNSWQNSWNWMFDHQGDERNNDSTSAAVGRFGKLTSMGGYVTDIFSSAQEKLYYASEETSKQISSLSNNLTSKVYSAIDTPSSQLQPPCNQPVMVTESAPTNHAVKNKQNFTTPSSSFPSRTWFMVDPYHTVTGRTQFLPTHHRDSVNAVRNLLQFVDVHSASDESKHDWQGKRMKIEIYKHQAGSDSFDSEVTTYDPEKESTDDSHANINVSDSSNMSNHGGYNWPKKNRQISKAVTASRLGEGTIRAMRDMALDEALELHNALRFWTERLERPLLYHLESGPSLWRQNDVDHHAVVGEKVSQLQAVLARRCSSIGQLQQHLWRAGWQSGVENWGILGQGEWAAVVGNHGSMSDDNTNFLHKLVEEKHSSQIKASKFFRASQSGSKARNGNRNKKYDYYAESHLFVKNVRGGEIVSNDSALAAWSIDALRVVRDQLYSAGNGLKPLPYYKNWPKEFRHFDGNLEFCKETVVDDDQQRSNYRLDNNTSGCDDDEAELEIPLWATIGVERDLLQRQQFQERSSNELSSSCSNSETSIEQEKDTLPDTSIPEQSQTHEKILISNLSLMVAEVTEILNSMESYMNIQRKRRLDKLKPPSRIHRNWYVGALGIPALAYIAFNLAKGNKGTRLAREAYLKILSFCSEHISEPLKSIFRELFTRKGRKDVTDRRARDEVISVLRKMIKSWLDEVHPDMPESERIDMAINMDMSLIENTKEDSVKNIFEIHNIYRLSLIEMQFIKKEMMNALFAMDELMGSNEINIKLAAMTPAVLLASFIRYLFRKLFYALLKIGKSKEETYTQFRHIMLDIERLLVMRDNPPSPPPPLPNGAKHLCPKPNNTEIVCDDEILPKASALSPDDLGMLMLLVHECRVILWRDRRRFSRSELRNVSEDLAELAGERGAVSVQQQLRIIARMSRTYSFLKVVSSGIPFSVDP
mmetsp:Transcript_6149/g.11655  ORF Transcript_6149/g.11655 Transcript_6149/m.11655 type:complete len:1002 (+) Transcript_6149:305-3310(+)